MTEKKPIALSQSNAFRGVLIAQVGEEFMGHRPCRTHPRHCRGHPRRLKEARGRGAHPAVFGHPSLSWMAFTTSSTAPTMSAALGSHYTRGHGRRTLNSGMQQALDC